MNLADHIAKAQAALSSLTQQVQSIDDQMRALQARRNEVFAEGLRAEGSLRALQALQSDEQDAPVAVSD